MLRIHLGVFASLVLLASCGDAPIAQDDSITPPPVAEHPLEEEGQPNSGADSDTVLMEGFTLRLPHKIRAASERDGDDGARSVAVDIEYFDLSEDEFIAKLHAQLRSAGFGVREQEERIQGEGARSYVSGAGLGRMVVIVNGNQNAKLSDDRSRGTAYFQWSVPVSDHNTH